MDDFSSPYIIPNINPYNPFPHSLLSTRELGLSASRALAWHGLMCNSQSFWVQGCQELCSLTSRCPDMSQKKLWFRV